MNTKVTVKSSITQNDYTKLLQSGKYVKVSETIRDTNADNVLRPIEKKTVTSIPVVTGRNSEHVSTSGTHFEYRQDTAYGADDRLFRWKLCRAISTDGKRFIVAVPRSIRQIRRDSINYALPAIRIVAERVASVKQRREYTVEQALDGFGTDF